EIGDVIHIDHALRKGLEVVEQRHRANRVNPVALERGLVPVEHPEEQQRQDRPNPRHHLPLAQRRDKDAERDEGRADQQQPDIAREQREQRKAMDRKEIHGVQQRKPQHHQQYYPAREQLSPKDLSIPQRVSVQQLDRAELSLLREQPHRQ